MLPLPHRALLEALRAAGNAEGVAAVFGPQDDVERAATLLVRGFNSQPLSLFGRLFLRTILFGLAKTRYVHIVRRPRTASRPCKGSDNRGPVRINQQGGDDPDRPLNPEHLRRTSTQHMSIPLS